MNKIVFIIMMSCLSYNSDRVYDSFSNYFNLENQFYRGDIEISKIDAKITEQDIIFQKWKRDSSSNSEKLISPFNKIMMDYLHDIGK